MSALHSAKIKRLFTLINRVKLKNKIFISYICITAFVITTVGFLNYARVKKVLIEEESHILEQALAQISENLSYKFYVVQESAYSISKNSKLINDLVTLKPDGISDMIGYYHNELSPFLAAYNIGIFFTPRFSIYLENDNLHYDGELLKRISELKGNAWFNDLVAEPGKVQWVDKFEEWDKQAYIASYRNITPLDRKENLVIIETKIPVFDLDRDLKKLDTNKLGSVYLIDNSGNIVISNEHLLKTTYSAEDIEKFFCNYKDKGYTTVKIGRKESMIINTTLKQNNWKLVSIVPIESLYSKVNFIKYTNFITIILSIMLAGILGYYLSGALVKRLNELLIKIKKLTVEQQGISEGIKEDEISELNLGLDAVIEKIDSLVQQTYTLEGIKRKLQLDLLLEQINPHFLYNTLACIKIEAQELGNDNIGKVTDALIRFYRMNLNSGKEFIKVKDEINMIKEYCKIYKFTYEKDFSVVYDMSPEVGEEIMLKFILQPIVENALLHGIYSVNKRGEIKISVKRLEDKLHIEVADNGNGMTKDKVARIVNKQSGGYGLTNIFERIGLYYGDDYSLNIDSVPEEGTIIKIIIPCINSESVVNDC
jgi:two-component system, sensor histidine kinase YesM